VRSASPLRWDEEAATKMAHDLDTDFVAHGMVDVRY